MQIELKFLIILDQLQDNLTLSTLGTEYVLDEARIDLDLNYDREDEDGRNIGDLDNIVEDSVKHETVTAFPKQPRGRVKIYKLCTYISNLLIRS